MTEYYATPTGAGLKNGLSWANAYDATAVQTAMGTDGNVIYLYTGTYTLTNTRSVQAILRGVLDQQTPPTLAIRTGRPTVACGSYYLNLNGGVAEGIECTGNGGWTVRNYSNGLLINSGVSNTNASGKCVEDVYGGFSAESCDFTATGANSIGLALSGRFVRCRFRCANVAINSSCTAQECLFVNCGKGINIGTSSRGYYDRNTFYGCGVAIDSTSTSSARDCITNNLFDACQIAIRYAVANAVFADWNNFHGNGTDAVNLLLRSHNTFADPLFADAANGDFRLRSDSPCRRAGQNMIYASDDIVGACQGAWQHPGGVPMIGSPFIRRGAA